MQDANAKIEIEYQFNIGVDNLRKLSLVVEEFINNIAAKQHEQTNAEKK